MRASEILRGLADLIDNAEGGQMSTPTPVAQVQAVELVPVDVPNQDNAEKTTMVPPLQQKIELLKKSLDVDNEFDRGFDQVDQEQETEAQPEHEHNDLDRMREMAGIKKVVQQELASDEPLGI
jgi:hypothetical protein